MGRYWLIALLLCVSSIARAADNFALQELDRYLGKMSPGGKHALTLDVQIDPKLNGGGEWHKLVINEKGFAIIGTSANMALTGVYHFLEDCGCRFLAPNFEHYQGSAEYVPPKMAVLTYAGSMMWSPKLKSRKLYVEEGHSHDEATLKQLVEWMPKVGYNTLVIPTDYQGSGRVKWDNWREVLTPELQKRGITIEVGGHGYQNFLNAEMEGGKLFDQHPEWFGANAQGQRQRNKGTVICTSNKEAVDYLINNFVTYIKARPEIQIYDFWPPDGAKWCECEPCTKLGTPSDRQAILVHQVKERVAPVRADLRFEVLAYHTSVTPPENQKLDKGILLDFCPISQQFDHQINDPAAQTNAKYIEGLTAWRKAFDGDISIYSYYRKYAWDSLPVSIPHYMQKDLQWYAKLPVQGVSVYSEPGDWFTYELNHYVLAALAWNPDADVDAIIKGFCDARYGGESDYAQAVFAALEKIVRSECSVPNSSLKSAEQIAASKAEVQDLVDGVSAARGRASEPGIKRNLQRLELMCAYALRDLEIQHMRATNQSRERIVEKATALHGWVKEHADDGVFLIKNQRLNLNRMLTRYGVGEPRNRRATATTPAPQ